MNLRESNKGRYMKKFKFFGFCLSIFCAIGGSLNYKPIESEIKTIEKECAEIIDQSLDDTMHYLDLYNNSKECAVRKAKGLDEKREDLYFVEVSKLLYDNFSNEVKEKFYELKEENEEISLIYSIFADGSINQLSSNNSDFLLNTKEKGFLFLGGTETISLEFIEGFFISSVAALIGAFFVPFIRGILIAAILVGVALFIITHYQTIIKHLNSLLDKLFTGIKPLDDAIKSWYTGIQTSFPEPTYKIKEILDNAQSGMTSGKWTYPAMEEALRISVHEGYKDLTFDEFFENKKKHVYLGRTGTYEFFGQENNGIYFRMDDVIWNDYRNNKKCNMWILNKVFLEICILNDCDFMLCSRPELYCSISGKIVDEMKDISYAKELEYIYKRGFRWSLNPSLPIPAKRYN